MQRKPAFRNSYIVFNVATGESVSPAWHIWLLNIVNKQLNHAENC